MPRVWVKTRYPAGAFFPIMRALRTSKIWLLLTLNALLILASAPAFASQCCCAATPFPTQLTHQSAAPKTQSAAIVLDCCASKTAHQTQSAAAPHHSLSAQFKTAHLKRVCSCVTPEIVAADDNARCVHPISHFAATLPAHRAPQVLAARFFFSDATFLSPPAPTIARAAGRSPPTV